MDILGVVMAIVGLLTLLSLFSVNRSGLTGGWIHILAQVFGWGVYILPVAAVGRLSDAIPEPERILLAQVEKGL
jgi:threonine/homoserine efflux transporter RhtA